MQRPVWACTIKVFPAMSEDPAPHPPLSFTQPPASSLSTLFPMGRLHVHTSNAMYCRSDLFCLPIKPKHEQHLAMNWNGDGDGDSRLPTPDYRLL
ncbi:uncharacterized protein LOC110177488 [Drosophila serrata]|uniref:uncharacterized protein LOC110177488 n=1 Tax=Drosophila serrata TaxID=7274 RepID=UPI000A1D250B|nr:uncharacterized protein LOC110177488 [Drosophila serrata]